MTRHLSFDDISIFSPKPETFFISRNTNTDCILIQNFLFFYLFWVLKGCFIKHGCKFDNVSKIGYFFEKKAMTPQILPRIKEDHTIINHFNKNKNIFENREKILWQKHLKVKLFRNFSFRCSMNIVKNYVQKLLKVTIYHTLSSNSRKLIGNVE